jgi:hypothetical protein
MIFAHVATIAPLNTSRGCTTDALSVPSETISNPDTTFALFSQKTTNLSFTSPLNKN